MTQRASPLSQVQSFFLRRKTHLSSSLRSIDIAETNTGSRMITSIAIQGRQEAPGEFQVPSAASEEDGRWPRHIFIEYLPSFLQKKCKDSHGTLRVISTNVNKSSPCGKNEAIEASETLDQKGSHPSRVR